MKGARKLFGILENWHRQAIVGRPMRIVFGSLAIAMSWSKRTLAKKAAATSATLVIDRSKVSHFGITAQAIDDTLYDAFGQRQIATLFTQLNQYHVADEVDPSFQLTTDALAHPAGCLLASCR